MPVMFHNKTANASNIIELIYSKENIHSQKLCFRNIFNSIMSLLHKFQQNISIKMAYICEKI